MPAKIKVTANGEPFEVFLGQSLADFLVERGLAPGRAVVERNGFPVSPSENEATLLQNGDVLEIVQIVAGG